MDESRFSPPQKPNPPHFKLCNPDTANPVQTDTQPPQPTRYVVVIPSSQEEQLIIAENMGILRKDFPNKEAFIHAISKLSQTYSLCILDTQESLAPGEGGSFVFTNSDGEKYGVGVPACAIFTYDASNGRKSQLFEKFPVEVRALAAHHETPAHYIPIQAAWIVAAYSVSDACNLALGQCAQYLKVCKG